jgi:hypothetical protein
VAAQSLIVSAKFPASVGLILTSGLSTPLYKGSANARDELRAKGETEIRLRPTVSGPMFLKHTLEVVNFHVTTFHLRTQTHTLSLTHTNTHVTT